MPNKKSKNDGVGAFSFISLVHMDRKLKLQLITHSLSHYLANMGREVPEIKMHLFPLWV